jgi:hypothetical protein
MGCPLTGTPILSITSDNTHGVTLVWTAISGANRYTIKYGTASGVYTGTVDLGNVTTYTFTALTWGLTYYFVIYANYYENILELDFNGSDASTTITDTSTDGEDSPHTCTVGNNAQLDTVQKYSGTASLYIPDTKADNVVVDSSTDFDWNQDFILQCRFRLNDAPSVGTRIDFWGRGSPTNGNSSNVYYLYSGISGQVIRISSREGLTTIQKTYYLETGLSEDTWYTLKVINSENNFSVFIESSDLGTQNISTYFSGDNIDLFIMYPGLPVRSDVCWIDEYYFYKGDCPTADSNEVSVLYEYDLIDAQYDCGYAGVARSTISDLSHLNGQTVSILANGIVLEQQIVADGKVELGDSYSVVHIGLPYEADLETLKLEIPKQSGTIQGKNVKINNAIFMMQNTRGGYLGPNENDLWEAFTTDAINKSSGSNLEATEMFTGDLRQPVVGGFGVEGNVFYRQVDPLPVTIGAIMFEVDVGGNVR